MAPRSSEMAYPWRTYPALTFLTPLEIRVGGKHFDEKETDGQVLWLHFWKNAVEILRIGGLYSTFVDSANHFPFTESGHGLVQSRNRVAVVSPL